MENNFHLALMLSLFAGLSTCFGALIVFFTNKTNKNILAFGLGLSAGVMIYISMVEFIPSAIDLSHNYLNNLVLAKWITLTAFIVGALLFMLIDRLVPKENNPHDIKLVENKHKTPSLLRVGILTSIGIGLHNFPEGMATFVGTTINVEIGYIIAFAVAIHNIPEGISVALPIYNATNSKFKAFSYTFFSGISEPIGALLAYFFLAPFLTPLFLTIIYGLIAGMMVMIALSELLPSSRIYGKPHISMYGVLSGMIIMGISLIFIS